MLRRAPAVPESNGMGGESSETTPTVPKIADTWVVYILLLPYVRVHCYEHTDWLKNNTKPIDFSSKLEATRPSTVYSPQSLFSI